MKWPGVLFVLVAVGLEASSKSQISRKIDWNNVKFTKNFPPKLLGNSVSDFSEYTSRITSNRIIGGEIATAGQFPYQVALLTNYGWWCGGSLISSTFVLTAAQCPDGASYLFVYIGAQNIRDYEEIREEFEIAANLSIIHPDFDYSSEANDIALVPLPRPIEFTDRIQPIVLPTRSEALSNLENKYVTVSGWGRTGNNANDISENLRFVQLQVLPDTISKHFFRTTFRDTNMGTDTGRGQGTCVGDTGTPMTYSRADGTPVIVGLISFYSLMGCVTGWPTVSTRIGSYLDWISANSGVLIEN